MNEAEGVEIHHGMEVGVVAHILTLLDAVVAHHLREQVAGGGPLNGALDTAGGAKKV